MNPADVAQAAPVAHDLSFFGLFWQAHFIVKLVMIGLLAASVWCWAIIVDKTLLYRRTKRALDAFEEMREITVRCTVSGWYLHWLLTRAGDDTFAEFEVGMDPKHLGYRAIGIDLVPERLDRARRNGVETFNLDEHAKDLGDVIPGGGEQRCSRALTGLERVIDHGLPVDHVAGAEDPGVAEGGLQDPAALDLLRDGGSAARSSSLVSCSAISTRSPGRTPSERLQTQLAHDVAERRPCRVRGMEHRAGLLRRSGRQLAHPHDHRGDHLVGADAVEDLADRALRGTGVLTVHQHERTLVVQGTPATMGP